MAVVDESLGVSHLQLQRQKCAVHTPGLASIVVEAWFTEARCLERVLPLAREGLFVLGTRRCRSGRLQLQQTRPVRERRKRPRLAPPISSVARVVELPVGERQHRLRQHACSWRLARSHGIRRTAGANAGKSLVAPAGLPPAQFADEQMVEVLCWRLGDAEIGEVSKGRSLAAKNMTECGEDRDGYGDHAVSFSYGPLRLKRHDNVACSLSDMILETGAHVRREAWLDIWACAGLRIEGPRATSRPRQTRMGLPSLMLK